jgi:hypothetical protein
MTTKIYFDRARTANTWGKRLFWCFFALSLVTLLFQQKEIQEIARALLIVATLGIVIGALGSIWQNEGNRLLRSTQLTNALNVPLGDKARKNYYNNLLPPSPDRLVATTFENAFFTHAILQRMLRKKRLSTGAYSIIFVLIVAYRSTTSELLVILAQTIFSVDLLLHWIRMERFAYRVNRTKQELHQFFLQGGKAGDQNGLAIGLAAFADYECAKDEAAMPVDELLFKNLNAKLSNDWDQLRSSLKIP